MHRFRKRSDAKRTSPLPSYLEGVAPNNTASQTASTSSVDSQDTPFDLPPASDFRTSLIFPDLARRFSLLRSSTGEPLSLEAIRSRLADQRARGEQNHLLEVEEDMILETLQRIRSKTHSTTSQTSENVSKPPGSSTPSTTSSSIGRSPRRYSNNLFGSSRHKESSYLRSVARQNRKGSTTPSEVSGTSSAHFNGGSSASPARARTPDSGDPMQERVIKSAPLTFPAPYGQPDTSVGTSRSDKRVSSALENVIKELEEEDEQIVLPRSPQGVVHTLPPLDIIPHQEDSFSPMAISPEVAEFDFEPRRASPVPSRTVPGYVPGMPRPVTPHSDVDERPQLMTPRAASPTSPHTSFVSSPQGGQATAISPSFHRSISPSPLFLHRSTNSGRFSPEAFLDRSNNASPAALDANHKQSPSTHSSISYQPMSLPNRPSTPSKLSWGRQPHSRSGSWTSEFEPQNNHAGSLRSLRSPPLPDSPTEPTHASSHTAHPLESFTFPDSQQSTHYDTQVTPTATPTPSGRPPAAVGRSTTDMKHASYQSSVSQSPLAQQSFNPFIFSPIPTSSRSSLESTGSSFHSESGSKKDALASLFETKDSLQGSWHDLSALEHSPSSASSLSEDQAEEVLARHGLKRADILAIQKKLVTVAIAKLSAPEAVERVGSLRRRRTSTSHSAHGSRDLRIASPPPRNASPHPHSTDTTLRAKALLNSVVENSSGPTHDKNALSVSSPHRSAPGRDVSPDTRRNRDLAQMIFGVSDSQDSEATHVAVPIPESAGQQGSAAHLVAGPPLMLSPSTQNAAELERQVYHKNQAAMAALRKDPPSPLLQDVAQPFSPNSSVRKKITPQQISTPTLVSASASVDTIPLPIANSPHSMAMSKFGSKLKRLRGNLRTKVSQPTHEELVPSQEVKTPPSSQVATYDPSRLYPGDEPTILSATEPGRYRIPVPSPPASAGPGLKGFMARFRGSKRHADMTLEEEPTTPHSLSSQALPPHLPPSDFYLPVSQEEGSPRTVPSNLSQPHHHTPEPSVSFSAGEPLDEAQAGQIKQFFDAGSTLGIDQHVLNALLARSASTSTQGTRWSRPSDNDHTMTLGSSDPGLPAPPAPPPMLSPQATITEALSINKEPAPARHGRSREGQNGDARSVVVRRTLIFASDASRPSFENGLSRRGTAQRKRASVQSHSSRSVHDRVPTPPPPRASLDHRPELSPPVPHLPSAFGGHHPEPVAGQTSTSTYDSLYDAYSGGPDHRPSGEFQRSLEEPGAALEVIQLANGETIWSIVNGLRDEDDASFRNRTSFGSDFSARDDVQLYFKDHVRHGSKDSSASYSSHRRPAPEHHARPDTKVFFSSPERIGKLIENLSQGTDAGSFNMFPRRTDHSNSSSMFSNAHWTMEDRLEHMLGSLNGDHEEQQPPISGKGAMQV